MNVLKFPIKGWWWRVRNLTANLITNGTFGSDTGWTKGTGWTIGSGTASSNASQSSDSDLTQAITIVQGGIYQVIITTSSRTAGNLTPVVGETEGTDRSGNATYLEYIKAGSGADFDIRADLDWDGNVDDVSVRRVR